MKSPQREETKASIKIFTKADAKRSKTINCSCIAKGRMLFELYLTINCGDALAGDSSRVNCTT